MRYRPTWVDVDLDAVGHNVGVLTPPSAEVMAVVKADAYGHGGVPVARAALAAGATWCGVALVEEGLELRAAGGKIDDLAFDRLRVRTKQQSTDARDQALRRHPEPTSFIGPAHAQLCDKPLNVYNPLITDLLRRRR